ncbi:MAG TPA: hypothetical protein VJR27_04005 [Candidatus Saccharimonadales bacterium]|nr:hypothetical protein [Candidatus Saccharimonadales bacterium]
MSSHYETPSLLSANEHLRMLIDTLFTDTTLPNITWGSGMMVVRQVPPIPDHFFEGAVANVPAIAKTPGVKAHTNDSVMINQSVGLKVEQALIAAARPEEPLAVSVGSASLVRTVDYQKRHPSQKPQRLAATVVRAQFQTAVHIDTSGEYLYRVTKAIKQTGVVDGVPNPSTDLRPAETCFEGDLIPVNQYLVDVLVQCYGERLQQDKT